MPVVAGLLGGVLAVRYRHPPGPDSPGRNPTGRDPTATGRNRGRVGVGLLLVALGGAGAVSALTSDPLVGVVGGGLEALTALRAAGRTGSRLSKRSHHGRGHHADLALGGVCAHRLVEGAAVGALYAAGAAVGVVAAVAVAAHGALETAAVGGLYAPRPLRALGATVLVQAGYTVGAVAGVGVVGSVPVSIQVAALGLVGGVLVVVGAGQVRRSATCGPNEGANSGRGNESR